MRQLFIIIMSLLSFGISHAQSDYQIDLILFAQPAETQSSDVAEDMPLIPYYKDAIVLENTAEKTIKSYHLLPYSYSHLIDEHYQLSRRAHYPILGHFSWRQPANNHSKVALPLVAHEGWQLQGRFHVNQSSYYSFTADLQVSPADQPQSTFTVQQKQRLKEGVVYYLDHERVGMLVTIHTIP